ncbi:nitric oxide synthase 1-like [Ylistrum balloti]|uniref:nitric oxide synthase 1-like n=1 Tax=Ylistrum balloti TaxID=509963 RepID=UPI002905CED8|nr:nitric oxide synthase 1-like [Ylistrum balloti]
MESELPNRIRVKLFKRHEDGLGFLIKPRTQKPFVAVSALVAGGLAEQSGLVHIGDTVLRVNEIDISERSYDDAVELLKALPVDAPVALILRGPDGYSTHLETTFRENGVPRTIRVTRKVVNNDSIVSRIRRTFSRASSASPNRNEGRSLSPCRNRSRRLEDKRTEGCFVDNQCCICDIDQNFPIVPNCNGTSYKNQRYQVKDAESQTKSNSPTIMSKNNSTMNHCDHSPTIVVTRPASQTDSDVTDADVKLRGRLSNTDRPTTVVTPGGHIDQHDNKKIEIHQNTEKITVVVKENGDLSKKHKGNMSTGKENGVIENNKLLLNSVMDNKSTLITNGEHSEDRAKQRRDSFSNINLYSPTSQRRRSSMAAVSPKKYVKLRNYADEKQVFTDTLHTKISQVVPCTNSKCLGSIMNHPPSRPVGEPRPQEELLTQAREFIDEYYTSIKRLNTEAYQKRWQEVESSIEKRGTYELTTNELTYGAKTAWRNEARCIGRIQWNKLQVFDARHITTARGMFEAICNHIKYGNNKGNIRSAITIFPARTDGKHDFRVWNSQLIRYAGYKMADGSVIGDPASVEFTEICQKMGWKGKNGMFDVLPLILQANGLDPELFEIPQDLVMEVNLKHPKFPWFADMGLKWYGLPAVSCLLFDCGGLEFTAAPFNGWYMGTEIGARDFCDAQRYNMLEVIATKMGLDTRKSSSLWKDRALVEMNISVLHSFQSQGVTITDHHAASESFMKFMENEQRNRGGCPADWVWVVPPMSGSITPVFHQEMLRYKIKPSYEPMEDPWKSYVWKKDRDKTKSLDRPKRKFGFKELARAVKFSAKLMNKALARRVKCTILYATETGKSERFANTLCEIFKHGFDAKVLSMDAYDFIDLEHEALVLFVSSTFGNGDPPENGESFAKNLHDLKSPKNAKNGESVSMSYFRMSTASDTDSPIENKEKEDEDDNLNAETGPLSNLRYSVFGLGSRAYPNFCAFAHFVDNMLNALGGERINKMGEGDELCGQEESFKLWAQDTFKMACETFCVGDANAIQEATGALSSTDFSWSPGKFRLTPEDNDKEVDITGSLTKLHGRQVQSCKLISIEQLQSKESSRETMLVRLDTMGAEDLNYAPGDHIAIFPANSTKLVDGVLSRLHNAPPPDQLIKLEVLQERTTPLGTTKSWCHFERIPVCTMRTAFANFLDITTPPSQAFLHLLATQSSRDVDRIKLENLANDIHAYEDWKAEAQPNLVEILEEFPSVKVNPSLLMTQMPLLQQRFYSISSSPQAYPGEIHATVAVVRFQTMRGVGPEHEGVCSTWLSRLQVGDNVPCLVRTAPQFHLPEDATLPIIMIGPGTGIAPFRSFWQQRKIDRDMLPEPTHGEKKGWGESFLYFGCRQNDIDHIYKSELTQAETDKSLTRVYTALSREPGVPKVYVQDVLKQNGKEVFEQILRRGGHVYVCGDVQMANDVSTTLCKIIQEFGKLSAEDAKFVMLKLREANRFHEDIFGVGIKSEATARDQAKRAWKYINAASKPTSGKEVVTPIPAAGICCLFPFFKTRTSVHPVENPDPP